jgi:serine/threonine protein kinase
MCALAKGIIRGLGQHFHEDVIVEEPACMIRGDPYCSLEIRTDPAGPAVDSSLSELAVGFTPTATRSDTIKLSVGASQRNVELTPPQLQLMGDLGPYRLIRLLGQGGMGKVFLAEDPQLHRLVVLKAMKPELVADEQVQQRFLREARAAASIHHDHIVPIYHIGQDRGLPFLIMPYLPGQTLLDRLRRSEPLTLGTIVRLARQLALGLAAAHEQGLVHRDIKPSNVWLEAPTGRARIMDFGLARPAVDKSQITQKGIIVGTLEFMSPEQAEDEPLDARSDLYSFGVVLYQVCTGRLPIQEPTFARMLAALTTKTPPSVQELCPNMPPEINDLIAQMLAKDPAQRPASARAVVDRLDAIQRQLTARSPDWSETVIAPAPTGEAVPQ